MEDIRCPDKLSPAELRQEIAVRLAQHASSEVEEAIFKIFVNEESGDLSTFPAGLRGGLSGPGRLMAEIEIRRQGPFTKAQIEQMAETLPSISQAHYQAILKVAARTENVGRDG